jgi:gluconolactonase
MNQPYPTPPEPALNTIGSLDDVCLVAEGLRFPEGPVAMKDGSVIVVEIFAGRVSRVAPDGTIGVVAETGGGPNGAAVGPDGALYICNNGGVGKRKTGSGSIQRIELDTGRVETLYESFNGKPLIGPNDLVFDSTGGLWFTDLGHVGPSHADRGSIYYASPDGSSLEEVLGSLDMPNGIALSPDESILYWAETTHGRVLQRRLEGPGKIVPTKSFDVENLLRGGVPDFDTLVVGLPGYRTVDSMAVDSAGNVCVATVIDSGITVVDPEKRLAELLRLPEKLHEPFVTNICFGGPDLTTAYITLSGTGRLVSARWPRPGLRLAFEA